MKIADNEAAYDAAADIRSWWSEGNYRQFAIRGLSNIVSAERIVSSNELLVFPERSSGHKALIVALGLNEG